MPDQLVEALERFVDRAKSDAHYVARVLVRAAKDYGRDLCPQLAAAISYHVLFSIFPLIIFLVSILALVLQNESVRADFIDALLDFAPLSQSAEAELERTIAALATPLSAVGLIGLIALLWSASGMMGAIRAGLNAAWDVEQRRPFLRGKSLDIALVFSVGLLVGVSIALTLTIRILQTATESLGALEGALSGLIWVASFLAPFVLSFSAFTFLYKVVPASRPKLQDVVPGAVVGALGFELVKNGFAFYLANFANYNKVYGSIGAVIAFLFFIYLAASVFLFGAEVGAEWPRVKAESEEKTVEQQAPEDTSLRARGRRAARRLF